MISSRPQYSLSIAIFASTLVHALLAIGLMQWFKVPKFEFELKMPSEVAIGIDEGEPAPQLPIPPATPSASPPTPPAEPAAKDPASSGDGNTEPPPTKTAPPTDIAQAPSVAAYDQKMAEVLSPRGGLLTLRVNMARIRGSALQNDVAALLTSIPDWSLLLHGSDVSPIDDLDLLVIAAPTLSRETLILAGRYTGGSEKLLNATDAINQAHGQNTEWKVTNGLATAAWHSDDPTPRIIARLGESFFVICREQDLKPFLTVLAKPEKKKTKLDKAQSFDALLKLDDNELLRFQAEGVHNYAAGDISAVPNDLFASAKRTSESRYELVIEGSFDSEEMAQSSTAYWERKRKRFAGHPLVQLSGVSEPLQNAQLTSEQKRMRIQSRWTDGHLRALFSFAQGYFTR